MALHRNKPALYGSLMLILGGVAHLVMVDIGALQFQFDFVHWIPASPISDLEQTTIDFGWLGKTNAFRAVAGFSVWVPLSLFFLASHNLLVFRLVPPPNKVRQLMLSLNFIISMIFLCVASACYVYPAIIGGGLSALFFAMAWRTERTLT